MLERAFGKVNLALDIVGRRGDGYHELKMLRGNGFLRRIESFRHRELRLQLQADVTGRPGNLAFKAVLLDVERSGRNRNFRWITKRNLRRGGLAGACRRRRVLRA